MKKIFSLLTVFAMIFSLVGCQNNDNNNNNNNDQNTIVFTHNLGETTVSLNPSKVVVFDFGILDSMEALGVDVELMVPMSSVPSTLENYAKNAGNAGGIKDPDFETLYNFEPDLIIISGRQQDFYDQLNEIAPTVFVSLDSTKYIEDLTKNINFLAEIFDKKTEADKALNEINQLVSDTQKLADANEDKALVILSNDGAIAAYGSGSRFGIIHDTLNVKLADPTIEVSGAHGQEISFEYITELNPDILFVIDRSVVVGGSSNASDTLKNDLVSETTAAKNDKIVYLDANDWYLAGGGISSVKRMITEIQNAIK